MLYCLIDRFEELEPGKRARAVKCVTKGEPFVADLPSYPAALVLEALIQAGGAVTRAGTGYSRMTVLGKIDHAEFPGTAHAGDRIVLDVDVILSRPEGTLCRGVASVDGREIGRTEYMIVYVPPEMEPALDASAEEQRRLMRRAVGLDVKESK
jgi:3-hydroxyacyl-[acyl-carrier-protein] dehydratase